ncbi:MAG: hypothetical protein FWG80_03460 [Alphaproteobacteria bacterium]|nr:hypothetical protein [Alphaproteobacteria bacterium]
MINNFFRMLVPCFFGVSIIMADANAAGYQCDKCYSNTGLSQGFTHNANTCPGNATKRSDNTGSSNCNIVCQCNDNFMRNAGTTDSNRCVAFKTLRTGTGDVASNISAILPAEQLVTTYPKYLRVQVPGDSNTYYGGLQTTAISNSLRITDGGTEYYLRLDGR